MDFFREKINKFIFKVAEKLTHYWKFPILSKWKFPVINFFLDHWKFPLLTKITKMIDFKEILYKIAKHIPEFEIAEISVSDILPNIDMDSVSQIISDSV